MRSSDCGYSKRNAAGGNRAADQKNHQGRAYQNAHRNQPSYTTERVDYGRLNRAVLGQLPRVLTLLGVEFRREAQQIVMLNPNRQDQHFGSFSISLHTGRWADFALDNARGGDAVSLVAYLRTSRQSEAAQWLREVLGGAYEH
jgi:hypothetical protein